MKKLYKTNAVLFSTLVVVVSFVFSCTRSSQPGGDNQDATLVVNVSGLEDYVLEETEVSLSSKIRPNRANITPGNTSTLESSFAKIDDQGREHEIYISDDFDIDFEYEKIHPKASMGTDSTAKGGLSMSAKRSLVARQPIGANVKYRLLIYRQGETTPIVNEEGSGTTFPATAIASGFNYRWIAVSTNETASSPTVANNQVSSTQISNKDFLFASGTFTSQFGQNYLNIIFKRYTTRIQLTVDSRGMFGTIQNNSNLSFTIASNGGTLSETGNFNVLDSTFSDFQPVALSSTSMVGTDLGLRTGTIFTVRPRSVVAGSLQLRLNPLLLTLDNGVTRTFSDHTVGFGSAFSPVRGSSYAITARLIESGVRVGTSNTRWARSNLTYTADAPDGFRYRFRPHPTNYQFEASRDLWNFAASTPTGATFASVNPCRLVYPAQAWRLPTAAEWNELPLPNTLERYTPLLFGDIGLIANWNRSSNQPANSAYPEADQLRLPAHGFRTTTGTVSNYPSLNLLLLANGQGHYFSSSFNRNTPLSDPIDPAAVRPQIFRMTYSGLNITGIINVLSGYNQLFVTNTSSPNNSSYAWNEGRSIRCVRNL